jgi:hypothetical protein
MSVFYTLPQSLFERLMVVTNYGPRHPNRSAELTAEAPVLPQRKRKFRDALLVSFVAIH